MILNIDFKKFTLKTKIQTSLYARKNYLLAFILTKTSQIYDKTHEHRAENKINKSIQRFVPIDKHSDIKYMKNLKKDMWRSCTINLIDPDEYFLFKFENLTPNQRFEFVGNREKELLCTMLNCNAENNGAWKIFFNKWQTYQKFKQYFGREVIQIKNIEDKALFMEFCKKYKKVIVKPSTSSQGRGIFVASINTEEEAEAAFFRISQILSKGKGSCVVEECIQQAAELAKFHPQSVNTVRITTFLLKGQTKITMAFLRMGCGQSNIDNCGADSGGIAASVNSDTGFIQSPATKEDGTQYNVHPDTGEQILGTQIPRWEELLNLVDKLVMVIPEQKYIGWDLALTNQGWVMIEGNSWAQFIGGQMSNLHGVRNIISETFYSTLGIQVK